MLLLDLFDYKISKNHCFKLYNSFYSGENLSFLFYLFCQVY